MSFSVGDIVSAVEVGEGVVIEARNYGTWVRVKWEKYAGTDWCDYRQLTLIKKKDKLMKDTDTITVTAGDLRRAAATCPEVKRVLKAMKPEVFEELKTYKVGQRIILTHANNEEEEYIIIQTGPDRIRIVSMSDWLTRGWYDTVVMCLDRITGKELLDACGSANRLKE